MLSHPQHIDITPVSERYPTHITITLYHNDIIPISHQYHISSTYFSHRYHIGITSRSRRITLHIIISLKSLARRATTCTKFTTYPLVLSALQTAQNLFASRTKDASVSHRYRDGVTAVSTRYHTNISSVPHRSHVDILSV